MSNLEEKSNDDTSEEFRRQSFLSFIQIGEYAYGFRQEPPSSHGTTMETLNKVKEQSNSSQSSENEISTCHLPEDEKSESIKQSIEESWDLRVDQSFSYQESDDTKSSTNNLTKISPCVKEHEQTHEIVQVSKFKKFKRSCHWFFEKMKKQKSQNEVKEWVKSNQPDEIADKTAISEIDE